jgi:prepilin-type N-terminal cleavage/methylation domain-containing protein/prepilin-type processing-associated H-X9-DG protein
MSRRSMFWRRGGFTLVELLVVIGIIALLISILLPSLSRAREAANQVTCQSQQKQIVLGMIMHASQHKGYMPLVGLIAQGTTPAAVGDPYQEKYDYYGTGSTFNLMSIMGALGPQLGQVVRTDTLANLELDMQTGFLRKVFVCPSDREGGRFGALLGDSPTGGSAYSSYAFNEAALGWADAGTLGVVNHMRLRGKADRFPHPAQMFLLTDGAPRGGDGAGKWQVYYDHDTNCTLRDVFITSNGAGTNPNAKPGGKDCGEWNLIDMNRHRKRMMVAFADGHVENVRIEEGTLAEISLCKDFPSR